MDALFGTIAFLAVATLIAIFVVRYASDRKEISPQDIFRANMLVPVSLNPISLKEASLAVVDLLQRECVCTLRKKRVHEYQIHRNSDKSYSVKLAGLRFNLSVKTESDGKYTLILIRKGLMSMENETAHFLVQHIAAELVAEASLKL